MLLEINIEENDIKNVCETVMTIDEMDNTLHGRIYCAIAKAVVNQNQQKPTEKTDDTEFIKYDEYQKIQDIMLFLIPHAVVGIVGVLVYNIVRKIYDRKR